VIVRNVLGFRRNICTASSALVVCFSVRLFSLLFDFVTCGILLLIHEYRALSNIDLRNLLCASLFWIFRLSFGSFTSDHSSDLVLDMSLSMTYWLSSGDIDCCLLDWPS